MGLCFHAMPATSPREDEVRAAIRAARDVGEVATAATRVRDLPQPLLEEGVAPPAITAFVTECNDLVTARLIELTGLDDALRSAGGCWIVLGSAGRGEQTLATDQDNAIVFADGREPEAERRALLPLAERVNRALDRSGYPLCRGEVMAGNPRWCLSRSEWRERFVTWIDRPEPEALLNAAIFFDFRAVHGERSLVVGLREWLAGYAQDRGRFLFLMVQNALENRPPLGLVRDFVLARGGNRPGTLDLKVNGVQLFVEAARIYSLADGVTATNTLDRLAAGARARGLLAAEADAWADAFDIIQRLRLRLNAGQHARGEPLHNHLSPGMLSDAERRSLKTALRQARNLQMRLARDFSVAGAGFGV
jgi:CBS domain-containing protein